MKILKTLAVFFVLLALTVGAVAEEGFTPYTAEELQAMTITLPVGMDEAVTETKYSDGLVQIYVDSDKVKWDYVAAQSTEWGGAEIIVKATGADNVKGNRVLLGGNSVGSANMAMELTGALTNTWSFLKSRSMSNGNSVRPQDVITEYSAETNTVTPIKYNGNRALMFMNAQYGMFGDDESMLYGGPKYTLIELVYTDHGSVKVEDINVPSGRIEMDVAAEDTDSYKSSGVVAYVFDEINTSTLETTITVPEGAASAMSMGKSLSIEDNKVSITMEEIAPDSYYASKVVNLLWYKEDGTVLDAERLVITVQVGDPIVWPNYIIKENFSKADVNVYFIKAGNKVNTTYMAADYSADNGTVIVSAEESIASANEDMTKYGLRAELTPPAGAAYGTSYGTVSPNVLGKNPNGYTLDGIWELYEELMQEVENAQQGESAYVEIVNGKAYFDDILFKETTYKNDPGLVVYYDANLTDKAAATLQVIDWRSEEGAVIGRQWFAVQYQPLAYTKPVSIETQAPENTDMPVLVAETAVDGYTLSVKSYAQTSESGMQIHYELELVDAHGEEVSLSELNTDVELLLPYQTEGGMNDNAVVYTVNHYDANGKLKESAAEDEGSVALTRVEGGILMTIKSLSPFVLSWVEPECEHKEISHASSVTGSDKNSEGVVVETCNDCTDHKASWVITVDKTCVAGKELGYKITRSAEWLGGDPTITYIDANAMEIFDKTPTTPGKYELSVKFASGAMLHIPFEVVAAPAMPATGDNSLPLIALMGMLALAVTGSFMLRRKANA